MTGKRKKQQPQEPPSSFRLNEVKAVLKAEAKRLGESRSAYVRTAILQRAAQRRSA